MAAPSAPTKAYFQGTEYRFIAGTSQGGLDLLKCSLCAGIVREPVESNCDHRFCRDCVGKSKSCPKCKKKFASALDKVTLQAVLNLTVMCPNTLGGCDWEGTLESAEVHLLKTCQHHKVECMNGCGHSVERKSLPEHLEQTCIKRARECVHLDKKGNPLKVDLAHLARCDDFSLPCPGGCGRELARKDIAKHLLTACPEEYVACKYRMNGCDKVMRRKISKEHEADDRYHFQIVIQSQGSLFRSLSVMFQSPSYTRPDLASLPLMFRPWLQNSPTCYPRPPWVIKLEGFEEKKRREKHWSCEPIHSHFGGYKMSLRIEAIANNDSKGPYLSTYVALMRGGNDDNLAFPYLGRIAVSLLNQREDGNHHTRLVWGPDFGISAVSTQRVTEGDRSPCGWGMFNFISHQELVQPQAAYLCSDSLFVRIDRFDLPALS